MMFVPMKTRIVSDSSLEEIKRIQAAWDCLYAQAAERLAQRIEEHEIPLPEACPVQDVALVYRFPNDYQGKLILPDISKTHHDAPYSIGLFLLAGPEAHTIFESHGVLPGDYVQFAKWAGEEETASRIKQAVGKSIEQGLPQEYVERKHKQWTDEAFAKKALLRIQAPLIHQSVDFLARMYGIKPTMRMVREVTIAKDGTPRVIHVIEPVVENIL